MLNWDDPLANFNKTVCNETQLESDIKKVLHAEAILNTNQKSESKTAENQNDSLNVQALIPDKLSQSNQQPKISLNASVEPVRADDKRVVNGKTDINQLAPFKYPWAWEFFLNANKNHWTPLDINMSLPGDIG